MSLDVFFFLAQASYWEQIAPAALKIKHVADQYTD